jgi:hypothetical protein
LLAEQTKSEPVTSDWVFDDQKPFIDRLTEPQRALYQAWLAAFGANIPEALKPAAAFAAWQQQA